ISQPLWCAPFSLERDRTGLPGPRCGLTASLSDTTIWRWLNEDAIRPWQHRCWIFPRDPQFEAKAGRILDLYQRLWKGRKLSANEFVVSADEKTSIQARSRKAKSLPTQPGQPMKIEHQYKRLGAWAYRRARRVFSTVDNTLAPRPPPIAPTPPPQTAHLSLIYPITHARRL